MIIWKIYLVDAVFQNKLLLYWNQTHFLNIISYKWIILHIVKNTFSEEVVFLNIHTETDTLNFSIWILIFISYLQTNSAITSKFYGLQ